MRGWICWGYEGRSSPTGWRLGLGQRGRPDAQLHVGVVEVGRGEGVGSAREELGRGLVHLDLLLQLPDLSLQTTRGGETYAIMTRVTVTQ